MVRRVGIHAVKAAKEPKAFIGWIGGIEADHGQVVKEAMAPAEEMLAAVATAGGFPGRFLLAELNREFNAVTDSATPAKLVAAVEALVADQEQRLPAALVAEFLTRLRLRPTSRV